MNTKNAHLLLAYDEQVSSEVLDEFCHDVEVKHLNLERQSLPARGPQSSLELLSFTAITAYLLKPYFEGFLQEAGKDHYHILKNGLKKTWKRLFGNARKIHFAVMTASGEVKTEYSLLFSIRAEIRHDRMVKLLIREDCTEDEYNLAIDAFLDLLYSYYFDDSYNNHIICLDNERVYSGAILIEFDLTTKSLRIIDPYKRRRPPLT